MKKIIIILSIISIVVLVLMGVFKLFVNQIFDSKTCQQFNIDNIELRTGIDIPAVTKVDCQCEEGYKSSSFTLNTEKVNIHDYLTKNNFVSENGYYINNGVKDHTIWNACFDKSTSKLLVEVSYQD